jgi:predicted transcriptional regulator
MFAIKLLRVMLGIGQGQLASRAGISVRELARIENAEVLPRAPAAKALDAALMKIVRERARTATQEST